MSKPRFEIYRHPHSAHSNLGFSYWLWRWRLIASNGRILAQGESHPTKSNARRALKTMTKAAVKALGYF